jgi:hypothetical protein
MGPAGIERGLRLDAVVTAPAVHGVLQGIAGHLDSDGIVPGIAVPGFPILTDVVGYRTAGDAVNIALNVRAHRFASPGV